MSKSLFLSAATGLMLVGSTAVFAQTSSATGSGPMKPGQTQQQSDVPVFTPSPNVGILSLKPGETVYTARAADLGSVQAGATAIDPKADQPAS